MYDINLENGRDRHLPNEQMGQTSLVPVYKIGDAADSDGVGKEGDQTGAFADFVRKQPILMLSVAFGLGLLATSFLARRRS